MTEKKNLNEEDLNKVAGGNWWDGHQGARIPAGELKNHAGEHFVIQDEWEAEDPVDGYFLYEENGCYFFRHSSPQYIMTWSDRDYFWLWKN